MSQSHFTCPNRAQWHTIRIPEEPCDGCTIRLLREAKEYGNYGFWSCADVNIVKASEYKEDCFGKGTPGPGPQPVCSCDKGKVSFTYK